MKKTAKEFRRGRHHDRSTSSASRKDADLRDLGKLFLAKGITGAPVIDEDGDICGVDLADRSSLLPADARRRAGHAVRLLPDRARRGAAIAKGFQIEDVNTATVEEVMTPVVHAVVATHAGRRHREDDDEAPHPSRDRAPRDEGRRDHLGARRLAGVRRDRLCARPRSRSRSGNPRRRRGAKARPGEGRTRAEAPRRLIRLRLFAPRRRRPLESPRVRCGHCGARETERMDRWWSDGTETGSRLWQGIVAIVATGCLLGIAQNALVRYGNPKGGLAWSYTPPKLDSSKTSPRPPQPTAIPGRARRCLPT